MWEALGQYSALALCHRVSGGGVLHLGQAPPSPPPPPMHRHCPIPPPGHLHRVGEARMLRTAHRHQEQPVILLRAGIYHGGDLGGRMPVGCGTATEATLVDLATVELVACERCPLCAAKLAAAL